MHASNHAHCLEPSRFFHAALSGVWHMKMQDAIIPQPLGAFILDKIFFSFHGLMIPVKSILQTVTKSRIK